MPQLHIGIYTDNQETSLDTKGEKMNKEKMFEIEIAKAFGQELVDKIKKLPDETDLNEQKGTRYLVMGSYIPS